jgi:hypothetical protein
LPSLLSLPIHPFTLPRRHPTAVLVEAARPTLLWSAELEVRLTAKERELLVAGASGCGRAVARFPLGLVTVQPPSL